MARRTRSTRSKANAGQLALALGYMARDPARAARILEGQAPEHGAELLAELDVRDAIAVLSEMMPRHAARHLGTLSPDDAATILQAFGLVDAAAILRSMDSRRRTAILRRLPSRLSVALNWALSHPESCVGAWTDSETLALAADISVQEGLQQVQHADSAPGEIVFVVNRDRRLVGMVGTTALLRASPKTTIADLVEPLPATLQAQASLASATSLRAWHSSNALPVVNRQQHYVGVLRQSDLERGLAHNPLQSGGSSLTDTLLEATEAYWAGLSALWIASFSLFAGPPAKRAGTAQGRRP